MPFHPIHLAVTATARGWAKSVVKATVETVLYFVAESRPLMGCIGRLAVLGFHFGVRRVNVAYPVMQVVKAVGGRVDFAATQRSMSRKSLLSFVPHDTNLSRNFFIVLRDRLNGAAGEKQENNRAFHCQMVTR